MANDYYLITDVEAAGLLPDITNKNQVHIIWAEDFDTGKKFCFFDGEKDRINSVNLGAWEGAKSGTIEQGIRFLKAARGICFHNGTGYDYHLFLKTYEDLWRGYNYLEATKHPYFPYKAMDTLILSRLLNPDRKLPQKAYALAKKFGKKLPGAHSIEAYGILFDRWKPEHEDWSKLTEDMIHRVSEDVAIGKMTLKYLMDGEWAEQAARPNSHTGLSIHDAYNLEFRIDMAVSRQAGRGFRIDMAWCKDQLKEMDQKLKETEDHFRPRMPQRLKKGKLKAEHRAKLAAYVKASNPLEMYNLWLHTMEMSEWSGSKAATVWDITKKNGEYGKKVTDRYPQARGMMCDHADPVVVGAYTPIDFEDIPLGNRDTIKELIYNYGWLGVNYNDSEKEYIDEHHDLPKPWAGKIDEDSIKAWEERGNMPVWAESIARWYIINSRRGQLLNAKDVAYYLKNNMWPSHAGRRYCRGIIPATFNKETGQSAQEYFEEHLEWPVEGEWRIPAEAFAIGTNTFRMRHRKVVNIPSRGLYPLRRAFIAADGKVIIGCDGAGLELRMLAHFMNDPEYTDVVLSGDIHTYNQEMAGLPIRDMAKTFIYAFLYGSGLANLALVCGMTISQMGEKVEEFKRNLPALKNLLEGVERAGKKFGYLMSVDGRWGRIRRRGGDLLLHTALNVLLQMTGSLVMKYGHIIAEDMAVDRNLIQDILDFPIVAHVHDEAQMESDESLVEERVYWVKSEEWKKHEKEEYFDEQGRMWSAPRKTGKLRHLDGFEDVEVIRKYHPIGECYALGIKLAGEKLKLRCPTAGEYMVGYSWAETH